METSKCEKQNLYKDQKKKERIYELMLDCKIDLGKNKTSQLE